MHNQGWATRKFAIVAVIVIIIAAYFGRGLFVKDEAHMGGFGVPVETYTVVTAPLQDKIDSVGTLVANESVILRPEVAGRITAIKFTEGQPVKKGATLFQIDDRIAQAELKQARANLQLAQLNHSRFATLSKTGAATKRTFDEARANLGVAQANFDLAAAKVDYANISAPFDGVVGLRNVSPGDYVNVGQELANFVSHDPMKVNFTIPETQVSQLKVGQEIDITVEAIPGETFRGKVYALDPQLDVGGRAVSLRATIPNPDYKLKPGFFARVALIVANKPNAITVPEDAIVPQGDAKFVYKVGADDTVSLAPVELGQRLQGEVEITSGLAAGDVVVTSGQIKLGPGAKVTKMPPQGAAPQGAPGAPPAGQPKADEAKASGKPAAASAEAVPASEEEAGAPPADQPAAGTQE